MLKAVLFDLDNTLIDRQAAFLACVREVLPASPIPEELLELDEAGHGGRAPFFAAWHHHCGQVIDQRQWAAMLSAHLQPDPALLQALKDMSNRFKLGLITNGGSHTQRAKLAASGLDEVFEPHSGEGRPPARPPEKAHLSPEDKSPRRIFISGEVALKKPDPEIFWLACSELGERPQDCLFVGDREDLDGAGARAAGMDFWRVDSVLKAHHLGRFLR